MPSDAKEKILQSAVRAFAQQSFRDTTVAKICEDAGTNIASVNYHFGSKENLYRASIREAFRIADAAYPIRGDLDESAPSMDKLKVFMGAIIRRSASEGPEGDFTRMIGFHARSDGENHTLVREEVFPLQISYLKSIVEDIVGDLPLPVIKNCCMNIFSLSALLVFFPHFRKSCHEDVSTREDEERFIEDFIERQYTFARSGLLSIQTAGSPVI